MALSAELKSYLEAMEARIIDNTNKAVSALTAILEKVKENHDKLKAEHDKLKSTVNILLSEVKFLSKKERSNNLLFFGVKEDESDGTSSLDIIKKILQDVQVEFEDRHILDAWRLGKENIGGNRPILVKLVSPQFKKKIFEGSKKLYETLKIRISNDLSIFERNQRDGLWSVRKALFAKGIRSQIKNEMLLINNTLQPISEAAKLLGDESEYESDTSTRSNGSQTRKRPRKVGESVRRSSRLKMT